MNSAHYSPKTIGINGLTWTAIAFIAFLVFVIIQEARASWEGYSGVEARPGAEEDTGLDEANRLEDNIGAGRTSPDLGSDQTLFTAPYEDYIITQGPHGFSYGHMAIDIAAGKGARIKAPINGVVTELYIDEWGNPTLVIENEIYRVSLLHGNYKVQVGDVVKIGQVIGKESNQGYTTDLLGRSCHNRDCGYHTHLNVFDKRLRANVNPLDLIGK